MVHKLGTMVDLEQFPSLDEAIRNTMAVCLLVLDETYGAGRNIDKDDGGYILYAEPGTSEEELRACFDYEGLLPEYVELIDSDPQYCCTLYLVSHDFGVVILTPLTDTPETIRKELQNQGGNKQ